MKHFPRISIVFILLVCCYFMVSERWNGNNGTNWKYQFSTCDGRGYNAYLPQFFLKHDLGHQDEKEMYVNKTQYGKYVNKYFIGNAICWSPFFGAAAVYTHIRGEQSDGYTGAYCKIISLAALFWLGLALLCLVEILKMMGIRDLVIGLTLIFISLGTNLFYYSVLEPTMSHLYSFSTLCCLICFGMKYFRTGRSYFLWLSILAFCLSVMIRPINGVWIVCLLPWIAGGFAPLREKLLNIRVILMGAVCLGFFMFLQFGAYYLETGHWLVRTYVGEGFRFLQPELIKVLAGFRKGWFIYTPLALVAMTGFIPLWRNDKRAAYSILLALILHIYIIASWWSWSFADSFGHRAFIDLYGLVAILLACSLNYFPDYLSGKIKWLDSVSVDFVFISFCVILMTFNFIQTYQFDKGIMHVNSMDWKRYKYIFLKVAPEYENCLGGNSDLLPYSSRKPELIYSSDNDFSHPLPDWNVLKPESLHGKFALHFNGEEYGAVLTVPLQKELCDCNKLFARISITRFEPGRNSANGCLLVANSQNTAKQNEYYYAFPINNQPADTEGSLQTFTYEEEIPCLKAADSHLSLYLWNQKRQNFYITHMKVEIFKIIPDSMN